jgi:spectinomycin phosphotransferase
MLIKPNLKDKDIIACLQDVYGVDIAFISFLPLGADFNTAVYRVTSVSGKVYFLKLRKGKFLEASVLVPKYLSDLGIKQVIPPIITKKGQLFTAFGTFNLSLYPYIEGRNGVDVKISHDHWAQFGATIKKLHEVDISKALIPDVFQETFSSKWRENLKGFLEQIENQVFVEPVAIQMALFLKSMRSQILKVVEHAENLVIAIQKQPLDDVLCHADIHGWNMIVDKDSSFYIVDWDTLIFAPKERDLMFIGSGIWDSGLTPNEEELLFYKGYGKTQVNYDVLAYYRFERIIQDISDYCEFIFMSEEGGDDRMQCFEHLQHFFFPNGAISRAYDAYTMRKIL